VVVMFIALLYGLIAYGMAFALKESMTNAVSEAARSAVGAPATEELTTAYQEANDRLSWLEGRCCNNFDGTGDPAAPMEITAAEIACGPSDAYRCMQVDAHYEYQDSPLVPILQLPGFSFLFPEEINTTATVRLPTTSTNP